MAFVSVFAFWVEKILLEGAGVLGFEGTGVAAAETEGGCVGLIRGGTGSVGRGGVGLGPPMLSDMVGAGRGGSGCSGRSMGGGGGGVGLGAPKDLPGTNSNAPALSLLMVGGWGK